MGVFRNENAAEPLLRAVQQQGKSLRLVELFFNIQVAAHVA